MSGFRFHRSGDAYRGNRGFSLIEVLVALLVTSVGLLGLASLQITGMKYNHNAYLRSEATFLAKDLVERMRANRVAALNGDYDTAFADAAPGAGSLASTDLSDWKGAVGSVLPAGEGSASVNGRIVSVSLRWDDARGEGGSENPDDGDPMVFVYTTEI